MCIAVSGLAGLLLWRKGWQHGELFDEGETESQQGPRPRRYCRRSRRIDFSGAFTRDYRLVGDARSITRIVMAAGIAPTTRCHDVASSC